MKTFLLFVFTFTLGNKVQAQVKTDFNNTETISSEGKFSKFLRYKRR